MSVCKYNEYEHDCQLESNQTGFCNFHDKSFLNDEKNHDVLSKQFYARLEEIRNNENETLNCTGSFIPSIKVSGKIKCNVIFHHVTFSGNETNFIGATFSGNETNFIGATFSGNETNFSGATFSGNETDFSGATFSGNETDFSGATFSGDRTDFSGATFSGNETNFNGATFSGNETNFNGATFSGNETYFNGATFSGNETYFIVATFSGNETNFIGATFSGNETDFSGATFSGNETDFYGATFSGDRTIFSGATFSGNKTIFSGATFSGKLIFNETSFSNKNMFRKINFKNPDDVEFNCSLKNISFLETNLEKVKFGSLVDWGIQDTNDNNNKSKIKKMFQKINEFVTSKNKKQRFMVYDERKLQEILCVDKFVEPEHYEELKSLEPYLAIYRKLRDNYDFNLKYEDSGQFFIREMEMKRKYTDDSGKIKHKGFFRKNMSLSALYNAVSQYGESYSRPLWIVIFSLIASSSYFIVEGTINPDMCSQILDDDIVGSCIIKSLSSFIPTGEILGKTTWIDYFLKFVIFPIGGTSFIAIRRKMERRLRH